MLDLWDRVQRYGLDDPTPPEEYSRTHSSLFPNVPRPLSRSCSPHPQIPHCKFHEKKTVLKNFGQSDKVCFLSEIPQCILLRTLHYRDLLFCSVQLFPKLIQRQKSIGGITYLLTMCALGNGTREGRENSSLISAHSRYLTLHETHSKQHMLNDYLKGLCNSKTHIFLVIS